MKKKRLIICLFSFLGCILILLISFGLYVNDYYKAKDIDQYLVSDEYVTVNNHHDYIEFIADNSDTAIIFYPGAKVDYKAYAPLAHEFAKNGISFYIARMPHNLAILDISSAKNIKNSNIENWYMAGHSLGGAMAANYVSNKKNYKGLILFAAYSTKDLKNKNLKVISVFGENDNVLNMKKYESSKSNYDSLKEYTISGGNHSGFASYGAQKGDGMATITNINQIIEAVSFVKGEILNA